MPRPLTGRVLAAGEASGIVLRLDEPLSLWGGFDPGTGTLTDPRHPQRGQRLAGRVVVMPAVRGSSSSSSVLAEAARNGKAPAALLLGEPDLILAVGAAVAEELYGIRIPVVVLSPSDLDELISGATVTIRENGDVVPG